MINQILMVACGVLLADIGKLLADRAATFIKKKRSQKRD